MVFFGLALPVRVAGVGVAHVAAAIPKTGVKANNLPAVLLAANVRLSDDEQEAALAPVTIVAQNGYLDGGVTFSPFYGKLALMAEQVVHFDGFLSAGLGAVFDSSAEAVHPAVELGVGFRMFLTHWLTVRGDLRNYAYPLNTAGGLTFPSALILNFGLGIHLPLDFDYSNEIIGSKA